MSRSIIFHEVKSEINAFDFTESKTQLFKINNQESIDYELNRIVFNNLIVNDYENIIIPLCFGDCLSDFLGLRLAVHIRTNYIKNQCSNIFIYGFVGLKYLLNNECFGIIRSKGIFLIDYNYFDIMESTNREDVVLELKDLENEVRKVELKIPSNYNDSHSIANEWAIMRWSKALGVSDDEINKIKRNIDNNLYFKYLATIYSNSKLKPIKEEELKIGNKGKVLYIDDEAEKGWYEIFCHILYDTNKLIFDHLGHEFTGCSQDEIIELCLNKVTSFYPDVVILDLRLHNDDFVENVPSKLTGFKILQAIKGINPGIRVLIFTASNKVWNLLELQKAGANDFVLKESPEQGLHRNITIETIKKFVLTIQEQFKYKFEKQLFDKLKNIKENLKINTIEENWKFNGFINGLKKQYAIIYSSIEKIDLNRSITLDIVFLSCYNFLELFKDYYLNENKDFRYYLGYEEIPLNRYSVSFKPEKMKDQGEFIRQNLSDQPSWFNTISGLFIEYFKVSHEPYIEIVSLKRVSEERNNYIHGDKFFFDQNEVILIINLLEIATKSIKE